MLRMPLSEIPKDFPLKTSIMHAVDGPLEEVTVERICRRCGISRSKFYGLFASKYDIGHWYLTFVYDVSLGKIGRTLGWREGIILCLSLMDEERTYFAHTSDTPEKVPNLFWLVRGDREDRVRVILRERGVALTPKLQIEIKAYAEIVDILLREWVTMSRPCSCEDFADIWLECVPRELYEKLSPPKGR